MYYNNYIEQNTVAVNDLSAMTKKNSIQKALKFALSGFSLFFIGMLFFIVDMMR